MDRRIYTYYSPPLFHSAALAVGLLLLCSSPLRTFGQFPADNNLPPIDNFGGQFGPDQFGPGDLGQIQGPINDPNLGVFGGGGGGLDNFGGGVGNFPDYGNFPPQPINPLPAQGGLGGLDPMGRNALCPPVWNRGIPDFNRINWNNVDRRCEESWWHLYPFGERYFDLDLQGNENNRLWHDRQIDLDFFLPFMGFRFNYTFIFPEGFAAFSYPRYIQPPYSFPTSRWPYEPDPSLIAAFMAPSSFMFVGDTGISHVWYRVLARPIRMINSRGNPAAQFDVSGVNPMGPIYRRPDGRPAYQTYGNEILKVQDGRVEDIELLDKINRDIHTGMVGTRGFIADYALVITWERMGYGGAPKYTRLDLYNQAVRTQNTYQMVIATDEIRTIVMFNYANINWTSSTAAGAISGRGGKQSAVVGFNGGNGTGMVEMPWSAEGNSYKLMQDGSTQTAGRWLARVDESVIYGGCINNSRGLVQRHTPYVPLLGGFKLNISGPCLRQSYVIKIQLEEQTMDCIMLDMVKAQCMIPPNAIWRFGPHDIRMSIDGGRQYNFFNMMYIMPPNRDRAIVKLVDDPLDSDSNWRNPDAQNLTVRWNRVNITNMYYGGATVDITLWGYWEDLKTHSFEEILTHADDIRDGWKKYHFGLVQVRVSHDWKQDTGDGMYWSDFVPFGFYHVQDWQRHYGGENWPTNMCKEWFREEGQKYSFWREVEMTYSCPCTLQQAILDKGRFMPMPDCDIYGDNFCYYWPGVTGCFMSVFPVWTGSGQTCCYDHDGWLTFSQDYEVNADYQRFYSAGTPYRAGYFGGYPFKRPPYVPGFSNFFNDRFPMELCCNWAKRCEFFYWRRESSGCQEYRAGTTGMAYGQAHFLTYDGNKYTFEGKGVYVLSDLSSPLHSLMVQVRMEQPPRTDWNEEVRGTIITGVAMQDNNSAVVEIYARREFTRWRYHLDVYVWGMRVFFDTPFKKIQQGAGVTLYSPAYNLNTSVINVYFQTGAGVQVKENHGALDVMVMLPHSYNSTEAIYNVYAQENFQYGEKAIGGGYLSSLLSGSPVNEFATSNENICGSYAVATRGLLGTWDGNPMNDFVTPDCQIISTPRDGQQPDEARRLYEQFGLKYKADGKQYKSLFSPKRQPIYNPVLYSEPKYYPEFDPWRRPLGNASFSLNKNTIRTQCAGSLACEYDYLKTGRQEIAMDTLRNERIFEGIKAVDSTQYVSCGPLQKNEGVIKFPPGNNYLDGATVRFECQPEYFRHGDETRTCINGTWSPGWWAWCRRRSVETGLKWLTGILVSLLFVAALAAIFLWCYYTNVKGLKKRAKHYRTNEPVQFPRDRAGVTHHHIHQHIPGDVKKDINNLETDIVLNDLQKTAPAAKGSSNFEIPVLEGEPGKVGSRAL